MYKIQQAETAMSKLNSQRSQNSQKAVKKRQVYSNRLDADLAEILNMNPQKNAKIEKSG